MSVYQVGCKISGDLKEEEDHQYKENCRYEIRKKPDDAPGFFVDLNLMSNYETV